MKKVKPTTEGIQAEQSLRKAVANVIKENRRLDFPVAVMKDGKVVLTSSPGSLIGC